MFTEQTMGTYASTMGSSPEHGHLPTLTQLILSICEVNSHFIHLHDGCNVVSGTSAISIGINKRLIRITHYSSSIITPLPTHLYFRAQCSQVIVASVQKEREAQSKARTHEVNSW